MGNLFSNTRNPRHKDIYMSSLQEPFISSQTLDEYFENKTVDLRNEIERLKVELKSCRDENRGLKGEIQKLTTNYGKEIYTLGENCSTLTEDTHGLMKNQEIIKELLSKILETQEKTGNRPDASMYASVHSLRNSQETRF